MATLRDTWESTSFELEKLQCLPVCVESERTMLMQRLGPKYHLTFIPHPVTPTRLGSTKHKVAIVRQEGSNGDREMHAAFYLAGFDPWDINMVDLLGGTVDRGQFRGIVFVGGFSYADVNDSAKGWAGVIRFNSDLLARFEEFRCRPNTFSLGVCNGCQLMALLGWVPFPKSTGPVTSGGAGAVPEHQQPRFVHNASGRFESRWVAVKILDSPAVLLKGMADSTLGFDFSCCIVHDRFFECSRPVFQGCG
jgi:phosphoribosylformylglycinamidine synthase